MKKLLCVLFAMALGCGVLLAQAPQAVNYQAVARDNAGALLSNKTISLRITILSGSASGTTEYSETFSSVSTNAYGLFTIQVGTGNVVTGTFAGVKWGANTHYIKVEMDAAGGTSYSFMGSSQVLSVPYALYAQKSGDSTGGYNQSLVYDTASGNLTLTDAGGNKVANINVKADNLSDNSINDLKDVKAGKATKGQVLKYNGKLWVSGNDSLGAGSSTNYWKTASNDMYEDTGSVGIGTNSPLYRLHVEDSLKSSKNRAGYVRGYADSTAGTYIAFFGSLFGSPGFKKTGQDLIGVEGRSANGDSSTKNFNVGVLGIGDSAAAVNRGVQGEALGRARANQGVIGFGLGPVDTLSTNSGLYGIAQNSQGWNYGVRGDANARGRFNIGLLGQSIDTFGFINVGVYGVSQGNVFGLSYAGYFAGNSRIDGDLNLNGNLNYTGTLTNVSDARFKKDVSNITGALDIIKRIQPKSYTFKTSEYAEMNLPEGKQFGFIAQEMESILPNLVKSQKFTSSKSLNICGKNNSGLMMASSSKSLLMPSIKPSLMNINSGNIDYKGINYIGLIPILTEAIKEQQTIIDSQNAKIDAMSKRLDELEKRK